MLRVFQDPPAFHNYQIGLILAVNFTMRGPERSQKRCVAHDCSQETRNPMGEPLALNV